MSDLRVNTISASDGTSPVTLTKQIASKSQLCYDHANTTIDGSFNITSVVDQGTGVYAAAFVNNIQLGYSHLASSASTASYQNDVSVRGYDSGGVGSATTQTTNGYNVTTSKGESANYDDEINSSIAIGDLA